MRRILVLAALVGSAQAQQAAPVPPAAPVPQAARTQIAVLGTFHFGASSDPNRTLLPDLLGERRQAEVADVRAALARWQPTQVFVENEPGRQAHWDSVATAARAGVPPTGRDLSNEIYQLGIGVALDAGLPGVTCFDYQIPDPDASDYAPRNASEADYARYMMSTYVRLDSLGKTNEAFFYLPQPQAGPSRGAIDTMSVGAYIRAMNAPDALRASDYGDLNVWALAAGEGDEHAGADFVANYWVSRNLKMLQNLLRRSHEHDGRYLVIVGASHVQILTNWLLSHPAFEVVEARSLLDGVR